MKRTDYLGISLMMILILVVSAMPVLGQAAAQANQPRAKTQPEYNAYLALYNEKDPAKKADLGEKFIVDFKESEFVPNAYKMVIGSYTAQKNWAKAMDAADRAVALPNADNSLKEYAYLNAMNAAQNSNDINKVQAYGEKELSIDPNNLNSLITLSAVIPQKSPSDKAQLDKAADMATKALAGVQGMMSKASAAEKPQLTQIDGSLHATLGLIAYNKQDYTKSIQEYQSALMDNNKDDAAHYFLAYDYIALMANASKDYQAALKAENDAKTAKADQPTIDDLAAKRADLEDKIRKLRDQVIDELAKAVAINGPVAAQAKDQLTKQWTAKNDSTNGLQEFIDQKKAELGQ